jgi:sodium transport system permease protein
MDMRLWLRYLLGGRRPTPTAAEALGCGVLILVVHFFLSFWATVPEDFGSLARAALTTQLAVIATPALMMTLFVTNSPRRTLRLKLPPWRAIPAAVLLAVLLAPLANRLQAVVQYLYPIHESLQPTLEKMSELFRHVDFWPFVLVIALVPAVCEELAFRGFILSGFCDLGHRGRAIVYSALLFGLTHGILQQSLLASLLGVVLGYLAVQTGSILPCMVFHAVHNTLAVAVTRITPELLNRSDWLGTIARPVKGGCIFHWQIVLAGGLAAMLVVAWFERLSPARWRQDSSAAGAIPDSRPDETPQPA